MKKLIIILFFSPLISMSQNLEVLLNTAAFTTKEGSSYLEVYLFYNSNTATLIDSTDGLYYAKINNNIKIIKDSTVIYEDSYILNSQGFKNKEYNNIFFIDQKRIPIKNGSYELIVESKDVNDNKKSKRISNPISIDFEKDKLSISDIQLVANYSESDQKSILVKNGYKLIPFTSSFYPQNINELIFYFECYNTHIDLQNDDKYLLNIYIETFDSEKPLFNFNKVKRKKVKQLEGNLFTFDISKLPTGNYNLVCEIRDRANNEKMKKKLFFQRRNSFTAKANEDINVVNINGTFAEQITNIDSLLLYIDYLYPISTTYENTFAINQKKNRDITMMQKFFYNFWKERNNNSPEEAWIIYHDKVKSVNRSFRNINIKGYLTDRGRVYLQYGAPNSRHEVENATSTVPYEIWHYYKLNNQVDKKFVFVNSNFSLNEYKLVYSNVDGEVSNSEWRDKIEQDLNPTLGDDFNNNYINPR